MNRIILIDDHHIVRQGLEFLLSTVEDLEVIGGFSDGQSFLNIWKIMYTQILCY